MRAPALFIALLLMNAVPSNAVAQNGTENQESFLKAFVEQNRAAGWRPLYTPEQSDGQNTTEGDVKDLQALSYLQGYNPVPVFKNVTKYDKHKAFPGFNLFLSANVPGVVLMDMNGKTIHRWYYPSALLPVDHRYCANNWSRVRLLKNGDLLALVTFGGLLKIDSKSNLIWFRRIFCHHDFDIDGDGNIYTLTVQNSRSGDSAGLKVNWITVLSADGGIKKEISLYDLFKKYPQQRYIGRIDTLGRAKDPVLNSAYSNIPGDIFHANSIQVLDGRWASRIPAFKKGNLLISIRQLGVLICVDPEKEEIVWLMDRVFWKQGQHFAKLLDNGNMMVFDNLYSHQLSRVVEFDPAAGKMVWEYSSQHGRFFSFYLGECYRLPNGNTLITESTNGHSFEVTPDMEIVWEFYNPNQVDKGSKQYNDIVSKEHFPGRHDKLVAIIDQMQRIPIDPASGWLKDQT